MKLNHRRNYIDQNITSIVVQVLYDSHILEFQSVQKIWSPLSFDSLMAWNGIIDYYSPALINNFSSVKGAVKAHSTVCNRQR